jgi:type II secretory pathway predicted ATPase ExeA
MYLSYYNLKVKPFQMSTDPEFLWLGEKHKEALAVLKYAILENKGVLALTGDVGTGKTTLINALLKSLGDDTITATIYDARLEVLDFFNTVAAAFKFKKSFEGKGKFLLHFMNFLIKAHERHQKVLLIIDEAQGMNENLLEEIRLLSNLEAEYTRLLNIFFVGQNEFIDILQKYENRALRQRVTIRYHIDPLTLNETAAYIRHRLEVSGCKAPVFDSGAIDEIFFFSGGYPRLINIMCDHALLTGYVREIRTINANHIRECREELLVSKKNSGGDFEYPAGNQPPLPREPVISDPPREPMASDPPKEPIASGPSREPMASDLSKELMGIVNDFQSTEYERDSFGPRYSMYRPTNPRKIQKKRFFRFRSIMIFLLVAAGGYWYFFYGNNSNKTDSFATAKQKQAKKYFSMNETSKNDNPPMIQTRPEASNIPKPLQSDKAGGSLSSATDPSDSGPSRSDISKETESFQPDSSKTFSQVAGASTFSNKSNEPASITTNASDIAAPDLNPKTKATALPSKKPLEKIQSSDQTLAQIPPKSSAVAAAPSNPSAKAPVALSAPTIRKGNVRMAESEPAQVRETPKNAKSVEKEISKPAEKSETAESITPPVQEPNKAKEPEALMRAKPKKGPVVASSVSSEKQTTASFEKFRESLSKKKVISDADKPAKPPTTIEGKAPAALSVSNQKKPVNRADEKVASLGIPINKSKKEGRADLPYIGLMTRLKTFLNTYCRTYEQKDMDKFSTLFAFDAVEKGKPFKSWLPKYRQNFKRIDSIEYNIEINRYATQEETGLVKMDGTFHVRAKLEGSKEWLENSGEMSMILQADGNSFKVKQLDY